MSRPWVPDLNEYGDISHCTYQHYLPVEFGRGASGWALVVLRIKTVRKPHALSGPESPTLPEGEYVRA
jgi:hypothetical protein